MQYKDFNTEPSEEETEYAKWEGYKALVLKMRRQAAPLTEFDGAEVGNDLESDAKVGDNTKSDAVEVGDADSDAEAVHRA